MLLAGITSWVTSLQDGAQRKGSARAQTPCTSRAGCPTKGLLGSPSEQCLMFGGSGCGSGPLGCSGSAESPAAAGSSGQAGLAQLALGGVFALGSPGFQQLQ